MSLFARRVIQRYLDANAAFIPAEKLRDSVLDRFIQQAVMRLSHRLMSRAPGPKPGSTGFRTTN
jgi:hypothetical protein